MESLNPAAYSKLPDDIDYGPASVLYADDDIRIFESPRDSPDKWEEAGLIVVQVRDELFSKNE